MTDEHLALRSLHELIAIYSGKRDRFVGAAMLDVEAVRWLIKRGLVEVAPLSVLLLTDEGKDVADEVLAAFMEAT